MSRQTDLLATALAPLIWGSTYLVTTALLPQGFPLTVALLRALPGGLIILLFVRQWPEGREWGRVLLLGAFNFAIFWWLLFVAAYRLPGGVAATVIAIQPLLVLLFARLLIGTPLRPASFAVGLVGVCGVGLLVLGPRAALDSLGIVAGLAGAASMALGTVLARLWQPKVPALTFTAWQLTAGGLLLLPAAVLFEPALPPLSAANLGGLLWLGVIGAAATYVLWFRGIARLGPASVAPLALLSPTAAVVLGVALNGERFTPVQGLGMTMVLASVWLGPRLQQAIAPIPPQPVATPD